MGHQANEFRMCAAINTGETRVRLWDPDVPGSYEEVLDDESLREKLVALDSLWESALNATQADTPPRFVVLSVTADPSTPSRKLRIRLDTLRRVLGFCGLSKQAMPRVIHNMLPVAYYSFHYDEDNETPTSLVVVWRCPRISEYIMGVARVHLRTRNCFVWLGCSLSEDMDAIMAQARSNLDLLQTHPLYFLSLMYDQRFEAWTDWIAVLWRSLVELETATKMTHPRWRMRDENIERDEFLSNADILLQQLHAANLEICHSHKVLLFAVKFGKLALQALAAVENERQRQGYKALARRDRDGLEECLNTTLLRCDSMKDRVEELNSRISGQINVSFNLIAQRDSKINFAIAKLQIHDSRTVKGIAILTLFFLPATLVSGRALTLWTTNLWTISGARNWQVFLIVVVILTGLVFACWWAYGLAAKRQDEKTWPTSKRIEGLPPLFYTVEKYE